MAALADRVQETTTTTGTGTITLAGAVSGFQAFSVAFTAASTLVNYAITSGTAWEVGTGTFTLAGTTLSRTTILASSAAGAAITLSGTSTVFNTAPASLIASLITSGGAYNAYSSLAANAIDLATGAMFSKTITVATTFTVTNVPTTGTIGSFALELANGGAFAITWWSTIKWAGGVAPTLTATGRDILTFVTHDGGTTWSGAVFGLGLA